MASLQGVPTITQDRLRIVAPRFGETVLGGAESAMRRLGQALAARGWEVEVWTTTALDEATWSPGFAAGLSRDGDMVVRRFPVRLRRHPRLFRRLSQAAYHLPGPLAAEHAWTVAQGPYAPSLVRALATAPAVPTVFHPYLFHPTIYGVPAAPRPRILCPGAHDEPALRLAVVRRALLAADALWFNTPEERDLVTRVHPAAGARPWACGLVGVQAPAADRDAFATRHAISGPYVYSGGRATAAKGRGDLFAALELVNRERPVTLVLSGEQDGAPGFPWVRTTGRLSEAERWEALAGAAAVVVPGRLESLSLLALEAWAVGRPCVVNMASPVLAGHLRRGGGGLGFGGPAELARHLTHLLDHPDEAAALGARGREYVARDYRWDDVEGRLRDLIGRAAP